MNKTQKRSIGAAMQTQLFAYRRFWLCFVLGVVIFSVLLLQLYRLQVVQGKTLRAIADGHRQKTERLVAERGRILDRYGDPIVWNEPRYELVTTENGRERVQKISRGEALVWLGKNQSSATVRVLGARAYRDDTLFAHALGYVSVASFDDLTQKPWLRTGDMVGKSGLEKQYDQQLSGQAGSTTYEVNALGQKLNILEHLPPTAGQDIQTALDPYLSEVLQRLLRNEKGTAIVLDARTGQVLSMLSAPSYSLSLLQAPESDDEQRAHHQAVKELFQDPAQPLFFRAVSGEYPPGSVFKLVTALAGFEGGVINLDTQVDDQGELKVGVFTFGNWYYRQYGRVEGMISVVRAIARSNDIFFYKVAEWVGPEKLAQLARRFGLGTVTGIDVPGEVEGLVPDPEWKKHTLGQPWFLGNTYHFGIGQGDVLVTPLQIAQMVQLIAHGDAICTPSVRAQTPRCHPVITNAEERRAVLQGMLEACSSGGTAFPFFSWNARSEVSTTTPEVALEAGKVACKTGTAEFGAADAQGNRRTHGWFVAVAQTPPARESEQIAQADTSTAGAVVKVQATKAAELSGLTEDALWRAWRQHTAQRQDAFPDRIVIVSLVESTVAQPFREGSRDAAPIAKALLDWMQTGKTKAPSAPAPSTTPAPKPEGE